MDDAGYKKEHIKVQLVLSHRRLIVLGERPVAGNRWSRFRLEFRIPDGCDTKGIHARFENGVVRVTMPGLAPELVATDAGAEQEPSAPAKPTAAAAAAAGVQDRKVGGAARQDGGRAAPRGGGEEKQKDETVQKQEAEQRVIPSKDGGRDDASEAGEVTAASPSRQGYGFLHDRRKLRTAVLGVVLVLISLGIYVKYSLWP